MRILIDLQGAQTESRFRGIGRYSLALALALARNAGEHEIWLALNAAFPESVRAIRRAFAGLVPGRRIRVFDIPLPVAEQAPANAWRTRAAEAIRAHFLRGLRPDAVIVTSLFEGYIDDAAVAVGLFGEGARTAVVLYDLIPWLDPDAYLANPGQRQYYERKIRSLRNAGLLLAISGHSRLEAIGALGLPPERVVNISSAADGRFRPVVRPPADMAALRARLGILRPAILCVPGGFDERKNLEGLIAAHALLPADLRAAHQLVIASKLGATQRGRLERAAARAGLAPRELVLAGYVDDDDLVALYCDAALFVFPSRHEGFGLPALEAMACGAPVIGSDSTGIAEVIGRADALFDPASPRAIAGRIEEVLRDPARRAELRAHGLRRAAGFSWDDTARRALRAIEERMGPGAREAGPAPAADDIPPDLVAAIAAIDGVPAPGDLARAADCIAFNLGGGGTRQLLLDISEIVKKDARTGIQRVVRSLLRELVEHPPAATRVLPVYFDGVRYRAARRFMARLLDGRPAAEADEPVDVFQDDAYLALDLNAMSDAMHACHRQLRRRGVRLHFIVYDVLLLQHPEWWPRGYAPVFEGWLRRIAAVAEGLICISEAVAGDVRDWLARHPPAHAPDPAVSSFRLGADIGGSLPSRGLPDDAAGVLARLAAAPSFLMVGTVEPRKGHAQALAAFEQLWARGDAVNLVIVGKQGWMVDALAGRLRRHPEQGRRLFWLEGISDEYLEKVYAASRCLLAASEGEGFGLPLIEAAQHRLPILARDIPVFREVAAGHASYFDGLASADLAAAVEAWLAQAAAGRAPRSDGMPWLTWRQSARQLVERLDPSCFDEEEPL